VQFVTIVIVVHSHVSLDYVMAWISADVCKPWNPQDAGMYHGSNNKCKAMHMIST